MKTVAAIERLFFAYEAGLILEDITLHIEQGDFLVLMGPNGSGKTTLLKILVGLLKPGSGIVRLWGRPIHEFKEWFRIGYVQQSAANFNRRFPITVEEVVSSGRCGRIGLGRRLGRDDRILVSGALELVGMLEYSKNPLAKLSGGQQQKVFIAKALAGQPEMLLLDEPVAGLDGRTQREFYELLGKLNSDMGITLVMVTHDTGAVIGRAKRVACLNRRRICHGSPQEVITPRTLSRLYGSPVQVVTHNHGEVI